MSPQRRLAWATLAASVALLAAPAWGQGDADRIRALERRMRDFDAEARWVVPADRPIAEQLLLDYGATVQSLLFVIDDEESDSHTLRRWEAGLYARAELGSAHRFFGRLGLRYDDWNAGDSFDGRGDDWRPHVGDRLWYQFDLRGLHRARTGERLPGNVNLKVGKQFIDWGQGLVLSNLIDGALVDLEWHDVAVVGLGGSTAPHDNVDLDGTRPGYDRHTYRNVGGALLEYRGLATHVPYVFYLGQRDRNDRDFEVFVDADGNRFPTSFDYDSDYYGVGSRGSLGSRWVYRLEAVHERGRSFSSSIGADGLPTGQTREDVRAWAGNAALSYLLRDERTSRIDLGLLAGSGDGDRLQANDTFGGNRSGTTDRSFNALGYAPTGLALSPTIANLAMARLGGSTALIPAPGLRKQLRVGASGYLFLKVRDDAPLSIATDDHHFVGSELDLTLDWFPLSDVGVNLRYGLFFPGDAMPRGQDDPRMLLIAGVSYAF